MRDQPQGVRSVVLDSPFPPNANTPLDEALNVWESLQTLFADCNADAYCRQNYPNLERVFLDTVADLNDEPADDLFGDDFFFAIAEALNDTGSIPLLPWAIYAVSEGEYEALDELAGDNGFGRRYQDEPDRSDSEGMYNSVICRDEYAFGVYEAAEAATVPLISLPSSTTIRWQRPTAVVWTRLNGPILNKIKGTTCPSLWAKLETKMLRAMLHTASKRNEFRVHKND